MLTAAHERRRHRHLRLPPPTPTVWGDAHQGGGGGPLPMRSSSTPAPSPTGGASGCQAIRSSARAPRRRDHRHRLRRPDRARNLRGHARGRPRAGQRREALRPPRMPCAPSGPRATSACASTTSWNQAETGAHLIDAFGDRARAFVQVQNGCDHRCTFCIIPTDGAICAACRWAWWSRSAAWSRRHCRDRPDRRRHHLLRRRPAGTPKLGDPARRSSKLVPS